MRCLAGSLVKTLLSQEIIIVASGGDLKLSSKVSPAVQMPFLENILSSSI